MKQTTLGKMREGAELLSITNARGEVVPAARVTTGIPFPKTGTQRLIVRSAAVYGRSVIVTFTNGGCLPACAASTPCTTR